MTYPHAADDHALGLELKRRLSTPGINLHKLERLCGVSRRTLRWIRNTKRVPGILLVCQIGPWLHHAVEQ